LVKELYNIIKPFVYKGDFYSDEVILFCPFCDDKKKHDHGHLYLNTNSDKWHCFVCGASSPKEEHKRIKVLLTQMHLWTPTLIVYTHAKEKKEKIVDARSEYSDAKTERDIFVNEMYTIGRKTKGYRYLIGRGVESDEMYDWYYWDRKPGYVFYTVKRNGEVVYFIGRSYLNLEPRYCNPTYVRPSAFIFNESCFCYDNPTGNKLIYLVEGIFDALFCPCTSIPILGKDNSTLINEIINIIYTKSYSPVIALDPDAFDASYKMAETFYNKGISNIYFFKYNKKFKDFGTGYYRDKDIVSNLKMYNPMISKKSFLDLTR